MKTEEYAEAYKIVREMDLITEVLDYNLLSLIGPHNEINWEIRSNKEFQLILQESRQHLDDAIRLWLQSRLDELKSELEKL